jgi:aromatic ring-cleaving dioxygenase
MKVKWLELIRSFLEILIHPTVSLRDARALAYAIQ